MLPQGRITTLVVALLAMLRASTLTAAPRDDAPDGASAFQQDAQLTDVAFIDPNNGWAVGDRGVIWHTDDGGAHWQLQNSTVDCRLESVQFLDARHGWAAGGSTQPYTHASRGVLLVTRDGGEHWLCDRKLLLPALKRVKFFDAEQGWAIGEASGLFNSGVFTTHDGGRTWSAAPSGGQRAWLTGDFVDPLSGALAGRSGALAMIRRRSIEEAESDNIGLRSFRRMKLTGELTGWLVGDGGLVFGTGDGGRTWQTPPSPLPAELARQFDFLALDARGPRCWIAGSPGTRVIATADGGQTWAVCPTGQNAPIHALAFVDDQQGWAVGDLGTVLATRDGGRTWRRQRSGGARAALVGFFARADEAPFELLARLSADEGYLGVIEVLSRQDIETPTGDEAGLPERTHDAVIRVGGSVAESAWRFPLRHAAIGLGEERVIDGWNRANDGRGLEWLEGHFVGKIRLWRPEVVFTSAARPQGDDPLAGLVNQLVLRAVEQAGDPAAYPEQLTEAGLAPWKVQKVYAALSPGELGTSNIASDQIAARLGRALADLAVPARGLIDAHHEPSPANQGFRLLVDRVPQEQGQRDFFSGILLQPGGEARRALNEAADDRVDALRRSAQTRRNLQAILAREEETGLDHSRMLGEIGQLTRSLDDEHAAQVLFQLAQHYYQHGRWEMAAETFDLLVERYPKHPLSGAALVWLVQYFSSSEAAWRVGRQQQMIATEISSQTPDERQPAGGAPPKKRDEQSQGLTAAARVRRAGALLADSRGKDERPTRAQGYAKQLEDRQPELFAEPTLQFAAAAAHRNAGELHTAERFYLNFRRTRPHDAWWACAQGEAWLAEPQGIPPKTIWKCARTTARPKLDGHLDEPMWRAARPVELKSTLRDDAEWSAIALASYDSGFLYLAAVCRQAPGAEYQATPGARPRDADLARRDRIEVCIDLDRDFVSYYRLSVDHRGWTRDECWHDRSWNPNWFVAAQTTDGSWTIEAAIPLTELTNHLPQARDVWAVGIQRIVPGVGFQSWTTPASPKVVPEGFGYLIFE